MSTSIPNNPFALRQGVSVELLEAYVKGTLDARQRHDVELHMEQDPLVRDAVDGMRSTNAFDALRSLEQHHPNATHRNGTSSGYIIAGIIAVLLVGTWWFTRPESDHVVGSDPGTMSEQLAATEQVKAEKAQLASEIAEATALPESLQIGHELLTDRPRPADHIHVDRNSPIERMDPVRPTAPSHRTGNNEPKHPSSTTTSRRLVYTHELKLVHPSELYGSTEPMVLVNGTPANDPGSGGITTHAPNGSASSRGSFGDPVPRTMPYLEFMDGALGAFAKGDHRTAATELDHVLGQYPDDVNALFYVGLCYYDLGLFERAYQSLRAARDHRVDTFNEEAAWYCALTLERKDGFQAARTDFERIAAQGGFYAQRATERLK